MKWIISHQSALEFWRRAQAEDALAGKRPLVMKPQVRPLDAKELHTENFWGLETPLHVLVGSGNARKASRKLHCHVSTGKFPEMSFIRMDSGLTISSPELCFLQMAGELPLVGLVVLGYEFCGSYRLDKERAEGKGFREDQPLTSVNRLSSYIERAAGSKGCKNAKRALRYIVDGSASPMETILSVILVLPYKFGGFGFPKPLLNHRIESSDSDRRSNGKSGKALYRCDLYWPDEKVDVEYDSDAHHTGSDRIAQDAIRRNTLSSMGIIVVTVSRKQVIEAAKMRALSDVLAKLLGKRLKYPPEEYAYRYGELLRRLFPKLPMREQEGEYSIPATG